MNGQHRMKPVMVIQRGSSVPLNVNSCTNLANNRGYEKSIPISSTYNINIELPATSATRQIHKAEIYVPPDENEMTRSRVISQPPSPKPSPPPQFKRSDSSPAGNSVDNQMRIIHIPFTRPVQAPPPPQKKVISPPVSPKPAKRESIIPTSIFVPPQESSKPTQSPMSSPRSPIHDELDHDSLLMSSLDDSQDSRSVMSCSSQSHSSGCVDSACSIESTSDHTSDATSCDRVIVTCGGDWAIAVQMSCDSDSTLQNLKFLSLLEMIGEAVLSYVMRKDSSSVSMNSTQIGQLIMPDRRNIKTHVEELAEDLQESILITRAEGRRASKNGNNFVGTFIKEPVRQTDNTMIGKTGVLVVLHKKNKYTPAREFADQLGHHISHFRPEAMGKPESKKKATLGRLRKTLAPNPKHLMQQKFLYDNSVNVSEAARRAFVEIKEYVLIG